MNYRKLTIRVGNADKIDHSLTTLLDLKQRVTLSAVESAAVIDMCSILQALKNAASEPDSTQRLQSLGDMFTVQSICFAYETGVGQWDRALANPYQPNTREYEAYALGVTEGKLQSAIKMTKDAAQPTEYARQKLTAAEVVEASKATLAAWAKDSKESLSAMSRLIALRPQARELKHQRITEVEYHALPEEVKQYFTLVCVGSDGDPLAINRVYDKIARGGLTEGEMAVFTGSKVWAWSFPADANDTVRGSTEDGWAATVALVEGKGWHVTATIRETVFGTPCINREHGMRQAEEYRRKAVANGAVKPVNYPLDGIEPVSQEEYLKRHPEHAHHFQQQPTTVPADDSQAVSGVDITPKRVVVPVIPLEGTVRCGTTRGDAVWTWSVPVDESDTVRGSTEDGWAATVWLSVDDGWVGTLTGAGVQPRRGTFVSRGAGMQWAAQQRRDIPKDPDGPVLTDKEVVTMFDKLKETCGPTHLHSDKSDKP